MPLDRVHGEDRKRPRLHPIAHPIDRIDKEIVVAVLQEFANNIDDHQNQVDDRLDCEIEKIPIYPVNLRSCFLYR